MIVVGFGHRARQGKNTAAAAMAAASPLGAKLYGFGDALKAEVGGLCMMFGGQAGLIRSFRDIIPEHVQPEEGKARSLLQWYGTDYRRAHDPHYWIKALHKTLNVENPPLALITDVRFPNEAAFVKRMGGYLVKVERDGEPDVAVAEHESERALDDFTGWDYTLRASTKEDLERQARYWLGPIVGV